MDKSNDSKIELAVLAAQLNLIDPDQMRHVLVRWTEDKRIEMGDLLVQLDLVDADQLAMLRGFQGHAGTLPGDAAGQDPSSAITRSLRSIDDPDIQVRLAEKLNQTRTIDSATGTTGIQTPAAFVRGDTAAAGRFSIVRPHAKGGLGQVYVALDRELNRQVALKEIRQDHALSESSRQRFLLEAEVTGGLEHPGIVPVYGLGAHDDGRPYYAMRFIKGASLAEAAKQFHIDRPLPIRADYLGLNFRGLLNRLVDVCNAIQYAHARGVLHRDLKPGNIMLGKYGETLVVDWGLAKTVGRGDPSIATTQEETLRLSSGNGSSNTMMGQAIGTPSYMSPEAANGLLDRMGPTSDVFCLGATLYFLLTGQAPFRSTEQDPFPARKGVFPAPRQVRPHVPAALQSICLRAMAMDPADRYASAAAMADDLECWLADEPVTAHRDAWPLRLARRARRHRGSLVVAACAGLVLLAVTIPLSIALANKTRRLEASQADAIASATEAARAAELATTNAQAARNIALGLTQIAEQHLSSFSGQQSFREELMDQTLVFFEDTKDPQNDDPESLRTLAKLMRLTGNVKVRNNKVADGERLLKRSIEMQEQLAGPDATANSDAIAIDLLSSTYRDLASAAKKENRFLDAAESLDQAGKLAERLQQIDAQNRIVAEALGTIDLERVRLLHNILKPREALEAAQRCVGNFEIVVADPGVNDVQLSVALLAGSRKAQMLFANGLPEPGRTVYDEFLDRGRQWEKQTTNLNVRWALARLFLFCADDLVTAEQPIDEIEPYAAEALQRFAILASVNKLETFIDYHGWSLRLAAFVDHARGRAEDADAKLDQAIAIFENLIDTTSNPDYETKAALCYLQRANQRRSAGDEADYRVNLQRVIKLQRSATQAMPQHLRERQNLNDYERLTTAIASP